MKLNINNLTEYFKELLILSIPILIGNLGHTLIGTVDVLVVSRYGINELAAISIANSILFTIFIFGIGVLASISIILSNKRGQNENTEKYLFPCLIFSFVAAIVFSLLCYSTMFIVDKVGFDPILVPLIKQYIPIASLSIFGMFIYQGLKEYLQSYEIVKFPNFVLLCAVFVNWVLDVSFVFGFGIIPPLGVRGAALATLVVRSLMGIVMLIYVAKSINTKVKIDKSYYLQMIKIGSPIGLALTFEFLAFNIITVLVGREAAVLSAVHSILITISSATFMVPLSIATAVSVKVAYCYGAKLFDSLKSFSKAGLIMGVGFMALAGILLASFPKFLISLFTQDSQVIKIAIPLISIAAMYQVFDGLQVVLGGILKGFKMTKIVSGSVLFGYWFVGAPLAFILVCKHGFMLRGYWLSLAISLFTMGIIQAYFVKNKFAKLKDECV